MDDTAWLGPPIDVRPLFAGQHAGFVRLLRELDAGAWARPTACPGWSVHDLAAHVLGDHAGRLSMLRDDFRALGPRAGEPFPGFIDRINDEWVVAARRLSPRLLVDLLSVTGDQVVAYWEGTDPYALGGPVTWAGPGPAPVWLDAARDFTEYWTHERQIREATGRTGGAEHLAVVLDTFLRALPHTLRDVAAPEGTALRVTVPGTGDWSCVRGPDRWALLREPVPGPGACVTLDADTLWRLCTRGVTPAEAARRARTEGDLELAAAALRIVSIIWAPPG
jgi:uncharacterized protein (TIGR03083 family)